MKRIVTEETVYPLAESISLTFEAVMLELPVLLEPISKGRLPGAWHTADDDLHRSDCREEG